ncbi:MAG: DUF4870 domain-containing protein, partial [Verrucomicrobiota bacterium]|nr:DUF4870 domain-containing protein [Verrucomicrobiota bacterium]
IRTMETSYPTPPPVPSAPALPNVRNWNAFCHASSLLGVFIHFPGHVIPPLIVWLAKRDDSPEIGAHAVLLWHRPTAFPNEQVIAELRRALAIAPTTTRKLIPACQ